MKKAKAESLAGDGEGLGFHVPGLSAGLATHPVLLRCYRLALAADARPVPPCDPTIRSGDGPSPRPLRAGRPVPAQNTSKLAETANTIDEMLWNNPKGKRGRK